MVDDDRNTLTPLCVRACVTPRSASYLEIYNESIFDLLSKEREGLTVKHAGGAGIEVAGLTVHGVSSVAEVQQVLDMGDRCVVNTHARVRLVFQSGVLERPRFETPSLSRVFHTRTDVGCFPPSWMQHTCVCVRERERETSLKCTPPCVYTVRV